MHENPKTEFPAVIIDLLPTVCDVLGVDPPTDRPIDGTSILHLLRRDIHKRQTQWEDVSCKQWRLYGDFMETLMGTIMQHYS